MIQDRYFRIEVHYAMLLWSLDDAVSSRIKKHFKTINRKSWMIEQKQIVNLNFAIDEALLIMLKLIFADLRMNVPITQSDFSAP